MALKRTIPGLRFALSEYAVQPDEIDRYEVYNVINPSTNETFLGTAAVTGTSVVSALVFDNVLLDYPRNLECVELGTAAGMAGSFEINGYDQFGVEITETIAISAAENGGTTPGTKIFSSVTDGTYTPGTALGNGTAKIGVGTTGTTAKFGLPFKLGGTTDVVRLSYSAGTGGIAWAGGTIAAFVDVPNHAIAAPVDLVGTTQIQVWAKSTFNNEAGAVISNLDQEV